MLKDEGVSGRPNSTKTTRASTLTVCRSVAGVGRQRDEALERPSAVDPSAHRRYVAAVRATGMESLTPGKS